MRARNTWGAAVEAFLGDCKRRNLSGATLENYQYHLTGIRAAAFLEDHQVRTPDDMTADQLRAFESELVDAGCSPRTVDSAHRVLKNFLAWAAREGYGGDARIQDVKGPKLPQEEPGTFTPDEEKRMLAALKERPRDRMLVELMLRTGLRLQEVANLTVDDVIEGPQGAYVRVRQGKGRKDRVVPLDTPQDRLSSRLRRFIDKTAPDRKGTRALFVGERGDGRGNAQPLSASAIQTNFKRLSRETDIHINPHKFRHTFATRALSAGVDVMALQKALGHTTLTMVSRYVHYRPEDLLGAWRQRRD